MSALALLLIFAAAAMASLIMVSIANQKQARAKIVRHKLKQLRFKTEELEELVLTADQLLESRMVARLINDEIIDILENMLQLDSSAHYLENSLNNAQSRAQDYQQDSQNRSVNRVFDSDAQIAKAQHALTEMGRIVRAIHSQSRVSSDELHALISELSWAHLMADVISHIAQGHKAAIRGDFLNADAFYKKAKHSLVQNPHADDRRNRMIKEIGEINSGRRASLSTDLMHEVVDGFDADIILKQMTSRNSSLEESGDPN